MSLNNVVCCAGCVRPYGDAAAFEADALPGELLPVDDPCHSSLHHRRRSIDLDRGDSLGSFRSSTRASVSPDPPMVGTSPSISLRRHSSTGSSPMKLTPGRRPSPQLALHSVDKARGLSFHEISPSLLTVVGSTPGQVNCMSPL